MRLQLSACPSPLGPIALAAHAGGLSHVEFSTPLERFAAQLRAQFPDVEVTEGGPHAEAAQVSLGAYFDGALDALEGLSVSPLGTPFQRRVWAELRKVKPGTTVSYAALAERLGQPKAVRAVGGANGKNPLPIVVPCHRVIASDGTLGGYSGGLDRKSWLLRHEGAWPA